LSLLMIDPEKYGADREAVRLALEAQQIEARPAWKPMHCQPVFSGCRRRGGSVAEKIFRQGLCLPSGTMLSQADQDRIIQMVISLKK